MPSPCTHAIFNIVAYAQTCDSKIENTEYSLVSRGVLLIVMQVNLALK